MAESAQETFARLLKEVVAPALRQAGLRGSGTGYFLPDEGWWAQLGFQKSTSSDQATVKFPVNLKATSKADWDEWRRDHSYLKDRPPEGVSKLEWDRQRLAQSPVPPRPSPNIDIGVRIGQLIPSIRGDHWWYLRAGDPDNVMGEALDAVKRYAIPALQHRIRVGIWGDGS